MTEGVIATAMWRTKPQFTEACVELLRGMFPVTRQHKGFRSIRMLRSETDVDTFILIQQWESVEDHRAYMQFRVASGEMKALIDMTAGPFELNYWGAHPLADAMA